MKALPESRATIVETTTVAMKQVKTAAKAPSYKEVVMFHLLSTILGILTIFEEIVLTET